MKTKIIKSTIIIAILGVALWSCKKEEAPVNTNNSSVESLKMEVNSELDNQNSAYLETEFSSLQENQYLLASLEQGVAFSLIIDYEDYSGDDIIISAKPKKFGTSVWEIRSAVKYAYGILKEGGCIKVWMKGDNIYIDTVKC